MQGANIHDRASIERVYPRAAFKRDANANMRSKASVLAGVRILSSPDATGAFMLQRATRHTGEEQGPEGAVFLCPFAQATGHGDDYPIAATPPAAEEDRDAYDAFIDRIIATAREARFPPATGRGDVRLQGLRQ
jgi:hypothetical protein